MPQPRALGGLPDPADRIEAIDIQRGFALLGMIIVHFHQRFRLSTQGVERWLGENLVGTMTWMGIEQKAWGTFAFLFGAGFAVLLRRADARGQPVVALYLRRLAPRRLGIVNDQWLAFTYIGTLLLLLAFQPQWTKRLAWFGMAGRMALTNYVLQCAVIELLSSRFGLGLHLRPYFYALGGLLLFAAETLVSRLWMSRFRYGPLEWIWRSGTYLRVPRLRKA